MQAADHYDVVVIRAGRLWFVSACSTLGKGPLLAKQSTMPPPYQKAGETIAQEKRS